MQILAENGLKVTDENIESLILTSSQQMELDQRIRYMVLNSKLKSVVEGMGVLNHLIVPLGIIFGIWTVRKKKLHYRVGAVICLLSLSTAGFLMLYRQYLPAVWD